jgi:plastocyanin
VKISRSIMITSVVALALAGAGLAVMAALASTKTTRLTVTEVEYKLSLSRTHLSAGKTTLIVVDKGRLAHSLSISGPGLKKRLIAGTIKPGASRSVTVTLKAGTYTLWCPQPGHAALGMKTTLKAGSSSGGTTWG